MRSAVAVILFLLTGCASVYMLSPDRVEGTMYDESRHVPSTFPRLYSGVLVDAWCGFETFRVGGEAFQVGLFCFLDLPLSLAADTVLLPYKAYTQIRYGNFQPRLVPEMHLEKLQQREMLERAGMAWCARRVSDGTGNFASCYALLDRLGAPIPRPITRGDASRLPP
ncbi:MAG TPA: YceK/YidQ family lipoprotein [Myxococcales bacterium]|nr:YceK/YidQ family lipoprotein [Myxococcales bacterium]